MIKAITALPREEQTNGRTNLLTRLTFTGTMGRQAAYLFSRVGHKTLPLWPNGLVLKGMP